MAFYKQDIVDINLNTGSIFRSFLNHSIGFKNDDADRFGIRCFRDGEPVDLTGASCQAVFMAPNGVNIALTSYGTVSGNVAYVTLPPACYDYEGQFCLSIQLVGGGVTSTVRIVDGMVENTGASGAVTPTSAVPTYQEILATYDAMVAATSAANLAIAETFDATKAYPAGKYVINEGHLYRLTADHAANVTWANTSKVATNFGDDLSSLKSAFNRQIKEENDIIYVKLVDINVDEGTSTGSAQTDGGYIAAVTGYSVSSFIYIDKSAKKIKVNYPLEMPTGNRYSIVFYTAASNGSVVQGSTPVKNFEDGYIFDIPEGTKFVRIGKKTGETCAVSLLKETTKKIEEELHGLENSFDSVVKNAHSRNLFNGNLTSGYIYTDGNLAASGTYNHSDPIDVRGHEGETIYFSSDNTPGNIARFLCAYDENMYPVPSAGSSSILSSWTVPNGIAYFVFSTSVVARGIQVEFGEVTRHTDYFSNEEVIGFAPVKGAINTPKPQTLMAATLEGGAELKATDSNSIKAAGITYSLYAKVPASGLGTSGFVSIGRRASNGYEFGINGTNWVYLVNGVPMGDGTAHNLTIKDYIFIKITVSEEDGVADISIYTNGGTYHRTNTSWLDYHGNPGVFNGTGVTISDVKFAWSTAAIRRRIWVLGDSYISQFTDKRWPYYMKLWGFDKNILYSGYPGEDSYNAYFDLTELLNYGKPSVMIWAMGMNDGDNGAINSNWLEYTKIFLNMCDIYDITPILATIPCTPNADNSYKNAWVRESGYRYIEFANAVNVSQDSRTWYDSMISSDNVHPDTQGAIALAEQVVAYAPEVMTN